MCLQRCFYSDFLKFKFSFVFFALFSWVKEWSLNSNISVSGSCCIIEIQFKGKTFKVKNIILCGNKHPLMYLFGWTSEFRRWGLDTFSSISNKLFLTLSPPYSPQFFQITHPAGCMSQFIKFFGEQILILWKFALLRKRILIFSPPPVGVVCYRGNQKPESGVLLKSLEQKLLESFCHWSSLEEFGPHQGDGVLSPGVTWLAVNAGDNVEDGLDDTSVAWPKIRVWIKAEKMHSRCILEKLDKTCQIGL